MFPEGLLDALDDADLAASLRQSRPDHSIEGRLKAQMQADALQAVASLEEDETSTAAQKETLRKTPYSEEDIKEAVQFLRLAVCCSLLVSDGRNVAYQLAFFRQRTG